MGFGWSELLIIFLVILLFFGGKRLPGLARSLGSGINEFKKGLYGQVPEQNSDKAEAGESKSKDA